MNTDLDRLQKTTIQNFGEQWARYPDVRDDLELFQDHFGEIFNVGKLEGSDVLDIGSGTGRVVQWIAAAGAKRIIAVEPSTAMQLLKENTRPLSKIIDYRQVTGEDMQITDEVDFVISLGVIHHIPDPKKTLEAAFAALKNGGQCVIWVYGVEGQRSFVVLMQAIRWLLSSAPNRLVHYFSILIAVASYFFTALSRFIKFPLSGYFRNIFRHWSFERRVVCIFDQLRPAYAKYYRKEEKVALFEECGFVAVETYRRHGYSWTVSGKKL